MDNQPHIKINPTFTMDDFIEDANKHSKIPVPQQTSHSIILKQLLDEIKPIDFRALAKLKTDDEKLKAEHLLVICIEQILKIAEQNNWGICLNHSFIYLYNGAYWKLIEAEIVESFLGGAAERLGIDEFKAKYVVWRKQLYQQFLSLAHLPKPEQKKDLVLVNFKNGTLEISNGIPHLRPPMREDFLTYQLPFDYNPSATAPKFQTFLDKVQPDVDNQKILSEYLGYLFVRTSVLKLEKTLLLYGGGANGKSVFFEVVSALLGGENNVSNYSLQSLTDENGYYRAMLSHKLLNYASEINGKLETAYFKQLVSGEPLSARLPRGKPLLLYDYAKLMFNCNELPKEVEHTNAYFRRFIIIPFGVTIPEQEQDKELSKKINADELSGVFNWVMAGLNRLLEHQRFTHSESVKKQIDDYRRQSDTVMLFLSECGYVKDPSETVGLTVLFNEYRTYCFDGGYKYCSRGTFSTRLRNAGFMTSRKNTGNVVHAKKENAL